MKKFLVLSFLAFLAPAFSQAPVTIGRWEIAASNGTYPNAVNANFYNVDVTTSTPTASTAKADVIYGRANFTTGVICVYPSKALRNAADTTTALACATGITTGYSALKFTLTPRRSSTTSVSVNLIKKFNVSGIYDWDVVASNVSKSMVDSIVAENDEGFNKDSTGSGELVRDSGATVKDLTQTGTTTLAISNQSGKATNTDTTVAVKSRAVTLQATTSTISPLFTGTRINLNGAVNDNNTSVNVHEGFIATDGTYGYQGWGVGYPGAAVGEFVTLFHSGTVAILASRSYGGGTYRDFVIEVGGAEAVRVNATTGAVTIVNLAGVGSRPVLVDANGVLSAP